MWWTPHILTSSPSNTTGTPATVNHVKTASLSRGGISSRAATMGSGSEVRFLNSQPPTRTRVSGSCCAVWLSEVEEGGTGLAEYSPRPVCYNSDFRGRSSFMSTSPYPAAVTERAVTSVLELIGGTPLI